MRWFGKSWGAPVCRPETFIEYERVPAFAKICIECKHPIYEEQHGLLVPYLPAEESGWRLIGYHLACLLDTMGLRS